MEDCGDALGDGSRRLGGLVVFCVDKGYSVYAGNGIGGDIAPGTDSCRLGVAAPCVASGIKDADEAIGVES